MHGLLRCSVALEQHSFILYSQERNNKQNLLQFPLPTHTHTKEATPSIAESLAPTSAQTPKATSDACHCTPRTSIEGSAAKGAYTPKTTAGREKSNAGPATVSVHAESTTSAAPSQSLRLTPATDVPRRRPFREKFPEGQGRRFSSPELVPLLGLLLSDSPFSRSFSFVRVREITWRIQRFLPAGTKASLLRVGV